MLLPVMRFNRQACLKEFAEVYNALHLCRVLAEEGGNQSAAAKRLGISRTTLWRMLQKMEQV